MSDIAGYPERGYVYSEVPLEARIARKKRLQAAIDAIERRVCAEAYIEDPDVFEDFLLAQGFRLVDVAP